MQRKGQEDLKKKKKQSDMRQNKFVWTIYFWKRGLPLKCGGIQTCDTMPHLNIEVIIFFSTQVDLTRNSRASAKRVKFPFHTPAWAGRCEIALRPHPLGPCLHTLPWLCVPFSKEKN